MQLLYHSVEYFISHLISFNNNAAKQHTFITDELFKAFLTDCVLYLYRAKQAERSNAVLFRKIIIKRGERRNENNEIDVGTEY